MKSSDQKLWPFKPKISIIGSIGFLLVLLLIMAFMHSRMHWPPDGSINTVFIGIFLLSLLPIILAVLDLIIEKGGTVGYKDFKINFSKVEHTGTYGFTIPVNIGVRGQAVSDSNTINILDALKKAGANPIVIIDLEDGQAWWETRLLVLLSGAQRLRYPNKIVFVATKPASNKEQTFIGWAYPEDLLKCILAASVNPKYKIAYNIAQAIRKQWDLVESLYQFVPPNINVPVSFPWMNQNPMYKDWAYDKTTGLPNELFQEQILQNELGLQVEGQEGGKYITIGRIIDLFGQVLNTDQLDQKWPLIQQAITFYANDIQWIAITDDGKYSSLVSRMAIINEVLRPKIDKDKK